MKCKILVPVGCRSDEGLSKPIIKKLIESNFFKVGIYQLSDPGNFSKSYEEIESLVFGDCFSKLPDLVFITGDRIEMCAVACASFHHNVPIAHYFAGVLVDPMTTLDDINRHCITLWSDIQLVESVDCSKNVYNLFKSIGKKTNTHIVGITHLEDLEIDISLVPKHSYDLILINSICKENSHTYEVKKEFFFDVKFRNLTIDWSKVIWIGSNPDFSIKSTPKSCKYYDNLPRSQFLGLLKWCTRFITNSSSAIYEAKPLGLKDDQIVIIGDRNKGRTKFEYKKQEKLASEKIVKILKDWWVKKNE